MLILQNHTILWTNKMDFQTFMFDPSGSAECLENGNYHVLNGSERQKIAIIRKQTE